MMLPSLVDLQHESIRFRTTNATSVRRVTIIFTRCSTPCFVFAREILPRNLYAIDFGSLLCVLFLSAFYLS
jgi:hypothetical protein